MNPLEILGSLMQGGMRPSTARLERTLGNQGVGGGRAPAGFPGGAGGMPGMGQGGPSGGGGMPGGLFDLLGKVAGSVLGTGAGSGAGGGLPSDLLKTLGGSIFGASQEVSAGPGAAGAGAMSVFGTLAAQAIEFAKQRMSEALAPGAEPNAPAAPRINVDEATAVIAGLRRPANREEERQVLDIATLTIRAMIDAAKSDGRIDDREAQRLMGKLQEDGVTDEEQQFVMQAIRKPMETDAIVRAVPNEQVGAQIYAASLMAIEVDTDAERRYMQELARKLGLNQQIVSYLHQSVGVA